MSWAIWITGLPGSGKTAVARAATEAIASTGSPVTTLELDEMRRFVTPAPTYSDFERELVYRALVYVASCLVDAGLPVIVDATAHRRAWRDLARASIGTFAEVQLTCPLAVCQERERSRTGGHAPHGIYAAAGAPRSRVPGVDVPYEAAIAPELTIDTVEETPTAAGARIAAVASAWPRPPRRDTTPGWAVWITGLPGSGKTTIASQVAEALTERGVCVRVLDLADVRAFLGDGSSNPLTDEMAHRTLAYAAKRLSEAGMAVLVDATAPVRAWRDLARDAIARFAEVQLLCPAELCATRERAVRWRLLGCAHSAAPQRAADRPDVVLAYEYALSPEVTIHTDVEDTWSAVQTVLRLGLRLHHADDARVA